MSLINQMLQDLEKRQGESVNGSAPQQYAQYGTPAPVAKRFPWLALLLVLCVTAAVAAYIRLRVTPKEDAKPQLQTENQNLTAANQAVPDLSTLPLLLKMSSDIAVVPTTPTAPEQTSVIAKESQTVTESTAAVEVKTRQLTAPEKPISASSTKALDAAPDNNAATIKPTAAKPITDAVAVEKSFSSATKETVPNVRDSGVKSDNRTISLGDKASIPAPVIVKEVSPQQKAEGEFKQATVYQQQGRNAEAILALQQALNLDQMHMPARQLLISLLLDAKRYDDAIRELRAGLALDSHQTNFAMVLARLMVERAKVSEAVEILQKSVAYAQERADYLAFLAALHQKLNHHKDAIGWYRQALSRHAQNGVWWMGLGISLQAEGMNQDALEAFRQAKTQPGLGADLIAFVDQRMAQLQK